MRTYHLQFFHNHIVPNDVALSSRPTALPTATGRRNRRLAQAEAERERAQAALSARAGQLADGFGREKERFSREMKAVEALHGTQGARKNAWARFVPSGIG